MRLVLVLGPPAVGKMTVGRALARRGGFRLLHNHALLEPLLDVLEYDDPAFGPLHEDLRRRVVSAAAGAGVDLVLTFVWGLDLEGDAAAYDHHLRTYADAGGQVFLVELAADLDTRLARNRTAERLAAKPSKRDLAWSDQDVRSLEAHRTNTRPGASGPGDALVAAYPHLRIDTEGLTAEETADRVLAWLDSGPEPARSA